MKLIASNACARILALVLCTLLSLALPGCYWRWSHAADEPFPTPLQSETIPLTAGIALSGLSNAPDATSISPGAVCERLAKRMSEDKVFQNVVYPLTALAHVPIDVEFDVTVRIEEHPHWAENIIKAIFVGATFLLLTPILPGHFTIVVDLSATADGPHGVGPKTYEYRSEYDYHYTIMTPSGSKMQEWLETAQNHAIEDVLIQIKKDREHFVRAAGASPN